MGSIREFITHLSENLIFIRKEKLNLCDVAQSKIASFVNNNCNSILPQ